jgi:hypothetical protein
MAVVLSASVWATLSADRAGSIATAWAVMAGVAIGRIVGLMRSRRA